MKFLEMLDKANKEIRKALGKEVKVLGRSHCCTTCTLAKITEKYYIAWKVFSSGMNKNIDTYKDSSKVKKTLYAAWNLTPTQLRVVEHILAKYFRVLKPENESCCIGIMEREPLDESFEDLLRQAVEKFIEHEDTFLKYDMGVTIINKEDAIEKVTHDLLFDDEFVSTLYNAVDESIETKDIKED